MKFLNVAAVIGFGIASTGAFASELSILNFKVIRDGGGQSEALVTVNAQQEVQVQTTSCGFRELTVAEQKLTQTTLTGAAAADALAILRNEAILASDESITDPELLTGTWTSMLVTYQYRDSSGALKIESKIIKAPIVIINSKISDVRGKIESIASTAAETVCQ
jgi:hypothetical protein